MSDFLSIDSLGTSAIGSALGVRLNNPGNLTLGSAGTTKTLYPGQTGSYDANGFAYPTFGTEDQGFSALVNYVQRHIASGWTTVTQFVAGYLGTPNLTPDSANANPTGYLATVEKYSGLGESQTLTASDATALARGIVQAEGNSSALGGINAPGSTAATSSGSLGTNVFVNSDGSIATDTAASSHALADGTVISADGSLGKPAAIGTTADPLSGIEAPLNAFEALLANALSQNTIERAVLVMLGLLLLAAGVFALAKPSGVTLADVPKLAALAA